MEVSNEKIITTLASNMASSVGTLQVQLAKSTAVIEALQAENAALKAELNIRKSEKENQQKGDDKHVNESTHSKQ